MSSKTLLQQPKKLNFILELMLHPVRPLPPSPQNRVGAPFYFLPKEIMHAFNIVVGGGGSAAEKTKSENMKLSFLGCGNTVNGS